MQFLSTSYGAYGTCLELAGWPIFLNISARAALEPEGKVTEPV